MDIVYQACFIVYALGAVYGIYRTACLIIDSGQPSFGHGVGLMLGGVAWPLVVIAEYVYNNNKTRET
jgi:hypothetical protein